MDENEKETKIGRPKEATKTKVSIRVQEHTDGFERERVSLYSLLRIM